MKELRPHQTKAVDMLRSSLRSGKRRPVLQCAVDKHRFAMLHVPMENWKAIPGYEGLYEASDQGRVRRLDCVISQINRWGSVTERRLKGGLMAQATQEPTSGYLRKTVGLCKNGYRKTWLVHHLIAETFIGPRPSGMECAHSNGNSLDNSAKNLSYKTPLSNTHDKFRHGTMLRGSKIGNSKLSEEQAMAILAAKGSERLRETAAKFGIQESQVSRIQNGIRWGHLQ